MNSINLPKHPEVSKRPHEYLNKKNKSRISNSEFSKNLDEKITLSQIQISPETISKNKQIAKEQLDEVPNIKNIPAEVFKAKQQSLNVENHQKTESIQPSLQHIEMMYGNVLKQVLEGGNQLSSDQKRFQNKEQTSEYLKQNLQELGIDPTSRMVVKGDANKEKIDQMITSYGNYNDRESQINAEQLPLSKIVEMISKQYFAKMGSMSEKSNTDNIDATGKNEEKSQKQNQIESENTLKKTFEDEKVQVVDTYNSLTKNQKTLHELKHVVNAYVLPENEILNPSVDSNYLKNEAVVSSKKQSTNESQIDPNNDQNPAIQTETYYNNSTEKPTSS